MHRLTVLISGGGTNLQAIIDAIESKSLEQVEIGLVLSNRKNAGGLERAKRHSINTTILSLKGKDRQDYDSELASLVLASNPDLIVLAGFMHILSGTFLNRISTIPIINLHPALPGEFDGANAISRAFKSWSAGEISRTGVMVHKVVAEVDRGEVVCKEEVPFLKDDTLESVETRIHQTEHRLIVAGIRKILIL